MYGDSICKIIDTPEFTGFVSHKLEEAVVGFYVDDKYVFPTCSKLQPTADAGLD